MNDEAAESRGPATTGADPSQDAPAPSPARTPDPTDPPTAETPTAKTPTTDVPPPAWTPPPAGATAADNPLPPPSPGVGTPPAGAGTPPPGAGTPPSPPPPWFGSADSGPTFSREQLVRPAQGRYVAGVCAAIGRATNTDPVLWRVLVVVLGLFGGAGVLIYLLGWLGIRAEGDAVSGIESLLGRGRSAMAPLTVVLLSVAAVLSFTFIVHDGFRATLLGAAIVVGIALLIKRNGSGGAPAGEPMTHPSFSPQFTPPPASDYRPPFAPYGPYAARPAPAPPPPPTRPKPKRERSQLGRITFFGVLMVLGLLAMADVAGVRVPTSGYFAAALATVGLGLIVGAWFGRARGLIALAVLASLGLGVSSAAERYGDQVANGTLRPTSLAEVDDRYDFKIGNVTLDLRGVDFAAATRDITIAMNAGQVRVRLPANVDTNVTVTMQNGRAVVFGHEYTDTAVNSITLADQGKDGPGGGTLRLTVQVDTGNVEVTR